MWVCKRLDMPWSLLIFGIRSCFGRGDPAAAARRLEIPWAPDGTGLAVLSVRSGFDLLLDALELPEGSEILLSAITVKDMPRIVAKHGLVPVPVELNPDQMAPDLDSVRGAITASTRAIVVAHLFGGRIDLRPLVELAGKHGLLIIEDCAQAYAGPEFTGHPDADVSMFSFGPIKTDTALGGGLLRVRDSRLLDRMRQRHSRNPVQSQRASCRRLLGYAILKLLSSRPLYGPLLRLRKMFGYVDHRGTKNDVLKNFAAGDLFPQIRQRPCAALVKVLTRSLQRFDRNALAGRTSHGHSMLALLENRVRCPGKDSHPHSFWVFPIIADDPERTIARLRQSGFDAAYGESMCVVAPPSDRPELTPERAERIAKQLVYIPCYKELPRSELSRLAELLLADSLEVPEDHWYGEQGRHNGRHENGHLDTVRQVPIAANGSPVQPAAKWSKI